MTRVSHALKVRKPQLPHRSPGELADRL